MNLREVLGDSLGVQHAIDAAGLTQAERERALNRVGIGSRIASGLALPVGYTAGGTLGYVAGEALRETRPLFSVGPFEFVERTPVGSMLLGATLGTAGAKYLVDRIRGKMLANQIRKERAKLAWYIPDSVLEGTPGAIAGAASAAAGRRSALRKANLTDAQYAEAVRRAGVGHVALNSALGALGGGVAGNVIARMVPDSRAGAMATLGGLIAGGAIPNYLLGKSQGERLARQVRGE